MHAIRRILFVIALTFSSVLVLGCGPPARLDLYQPQLAGLQAHLHLQSERAFWSSDAQVERLVVEFPPPGASTGRPHFYLLYLRWPAGQQQPAVAVDQKPSVRGFLIQTRGRFAGLAEVVGGTMTVERAVRTPEAVRRLTFDLRCEDGSQLVGTIEAQRDDMMLTNFERRSRAADVANLDPVFPSEDLSTPAPDDFP